MATAHLLHGYLGAGKTTLALRLERELRAVRFTHDEWMAALHGPDPAHPFAPKAQAVSTLMRPLWTRCLELEVDVVLDWGFWRRSERDEVRAAVAALGARTVLHHLHCDETEARARVAARNASDGRSLHIAPATFDALRSRFEPLGPDEERVEG